MFWLLHLLNCVQPRFDQVWDLHNRCNFIALVCLFPFDTDCVVLTGSFFRFIVSECSHGPRHHCLICKAPALSQLCNYFWLAFGAVRFTQRMQLSCIDPSILDSPGKLNQSMSEFDLCCSKLILLLNLLLVFLQKILKHLPAMGSFLA